MNDQPAAQPQNQDTIPPAIIWDLPIRVFHWALALAASIGLYSGFENKFDYVSIAGFTLKIEWGSVHLYSGYSVLVLCLFRLIWGVFGSSNARLLRLFSPPRAVLAYAKTLLNPAKRLAGHNPMGGYASLILIFGFSAQGAMGLYAMDDYFYGGPLAESIDSSVSGDITSLHKDWGEILIWIVGMHITMIGFYGLVRKRNLIKPMITGKDSLSEGEIPPSLAPLWRAIAAAALATAALFYWIG